MDLNLGTLILSKFIGDILFGIYRLLFGEGKLEETSAHNAKHFIDVC